MAGRSLSLQMFSGILKEFQHVKQTATPTYRYLVDQYKANQTTSAKYCRDPKAATYDAATYYCLLQSTRRYNDLVNEYNAGEDSFKKAAERVGLKMPQLYNEGTTDNENFENDAHK